MPANKNMQSSNAAPSTDTTTGNKSGQTSNSPRKSGRRNNSKANTSTGSGKNAKSNAGNENPKDNRGGLTGDNGRPQTNTKQSQPSTVEHQTGASSNKPSEALTDPAEVETQPRGSVEGQNSDPNGGSSQPGMPSDLSSTSQPGTLSQNTSTNLGTETVEHKEKIALNGPRTESPELTECNKMSEDGDRQKRQSQQDRAPDAEAPPTGDPSKKLLNTRTTSNQELETVNIIQS
ncbi:hypothetical protein K440DRAFT_634215, partial [Wilcoxina mikolae CBS 423.85]